MMTLEKKRLSLDEIDGQTALELPNRELLALVNVVIFNVLNNLSISIPVQNNNVAVQVCAIVSAINVQLLTVDELACEVVQRQ